jgi:hypothetical protein
MPKIVIKEYDQTTPGFVSSNNFAVVVPGPVAQEKVANISEVFDENGVFVCSSQADFVEKVGKVKATATNVLAKGPTLTEISAGTTYSTLTAEQFYRTYYDQVYTRTEITVAKDKKVGHLVYHDAVANKYYKYTKATS